MKIFACFFFQTIFYGLLDAQIILNEVMADPSPAVGLPLAEYVEIRNMGSNAVSLQGYILGDKVTEGILDTAEILPGSVILLTSAEYIADLEPYGLVVGVSPWPALNNSGDVLFLKNDQGIMQDSVSYDLSWYRSAKKARGGWTLERIDPTQICNDKQNWTASISDAGGTPGGVNSVYAIQPDFTPPSVVATLGITERLIRIQFSEQVLSGKISHSSFSGEGISILNWYFGGANDTLYLEVSEPLLRDKKYSMWIDHVEDCSGNRARLEISVSLVEKAGREDLKITEVLFDPFPGSEDFIELWNNSDKYLALKDMIFTRWEYTHEIIKRNTLVVNQELFLRSGEWILLSPDPEGVLNQYAIMEKKYAAINLFNIPNEGGIISLYLNGLYQDSIWVDPSFHHELLRDVEGYSLERTNVEVSGWQKSAWMTSAHKATPGVRNSQEYRMDSLEREIYLEPEIIRPYSTSDNSLFIHFSINKTGLVGRLEVFDLAGYKVATILENDFIPTQGYLRWDGTHDDGTVLPYGYYILRGEIIGPSGYHKIITKRFIIAP
jgi:hypothetical protein